MLLGGPIGGPYWGVVSVKPQRPGQPQGWAAVVLEFWACSNERETGVQWRPFPGYLTS